MSISAMFVVAVVALLHAWFLVLEMFLWTKPIGMRTFRLTPEFAERSRALAANQGLYNGFLAAGLVYGLCVQSREIALLFLAFSFAMRIDSLSIVNKRIFFIQAFPAIVAAALVGWR